MSFEKLKKGLHIYFGAVIFMVLLFSVCGMVDKNSNSSSSNDVSKTEPGLIGVWGSNVYLDATLEIKNDGTMNISFLNDPRPNQRDGSGNTTISSKIANVDSTAKNLTVMIEQEEDGNKYAFYDVVPYYLSGDGKELVFSYTMIIPFQPVLWKKK